MEMTAFRGICGLVAAFALLNGGRMVLDPVGWFASIPDLAVTGAANGHLIRDVGTAYLASATGLAFAIWRPAQAMGVLLVAAIFMAGHGIGHLVDIAEGCAAAPGGTATDWLGVIVPGAITAALCGWSLRFRQT
jgi:hypothetical protein